MKRSPLAVAKEAQAKRQRASLGPAIRVRLNGHVHHGWFAKWSGTVKAVTVCGQIECCQGRGSVADGPVDCPKCIDRAEIDPELIKGE